MTDQQIVEILAKHGIGEAWHVGVTPFPLDGEDAPLFIAAYREMLEAARSAAPAQNAGDQNTSNQAADRANACSEAGTTAPAQEPVAALVVPYVDWLSNVIRKADGQHELGAGALAEKIVEAIAAAPSAPSQSEGARELKSAEIERGWRDTFSTDNPFCPCDLKTFTKAVRWAERRIAAMQKESGK